MQLTTNIYIQVRGRCDVVITTVESQREMKSGEAGRRQKERRHHREMTLNDMC